MKGTGVILYLSFLWRKFNLIPFRSVLVHVRSKITTFISRDAFPRPETGKLSMLLLLLVLLLQFLSLFFLLLLLLLCKVSSISRSCHTVDASYASQDSSFSIQQLIFRLLTLHLSHAKLPLVLILLPLGSTKLHFNLTQANDQMESRREKIEIVIEIERGRGQSRKSIAREIKSPDENLDPQILCFSFNFVTKKV